ncbi:hypothetical protein HK405_016027, partial [Cladochytrium tenue]
MSYAGRIVVATGRLTLYCSRAISSGFGSASSFVASSLLQRWGWQLAPAAPPPPPPPPKTPAAA